MHTHTHTHNTPTHTHTGDQINGQGITGLTILLISGFAYSYFRSQLQSVKK